jgi:hypothetical protein
MVPEATGACCCGATCLLRTAALCTGANTFFAGGGTVCNTFGANNRAPCCLANYNQTRDAQNQPTVTVQDIFDFLGGYFSNDPKANINGSATVSVQDIFDFLGAYFAGCS